MEKVSGTVFNWYVERNGDPSTRRSFTSEALAQEYASIYDRISDGDTTTRIYLAPTIEMVEIAKEVGEEHSLKGVYAVVEESVSKHKPKKANGRPWVPTVVVSVLLVACAALGFGVTPSRPTKTPPPQTVKCPISGIDLVLLPSGTVTMGSSEADRNYVLDNVNLQRWNKLRVQSELQRLADVPRFYLATTPVTIRQFRQFVTATGHITTGESDDEGGWGRVNNAWVRSNDYTFDNLGEDIEIDDRMPAMNISYRDALEYCLWLSNETGRTYRLPTEAEWEYAARGGTDTRWHTGNDLLNATNCGWTAASSGGIPHPVGLFEPNEFGLYDMIGGGWEWCADHFSDDRPWRVLKGGSFRATPWLARSASRSGLREDYVGANGFRVVLEP